MEAARMRIRIIRVPAPLHALLRDLHAPLPLVQPPWLLRLGSAGLALSLLPLPRLSFPTTPLLALTSFWICRNPTTSVPPRRLHNLSPANASSVILRTPRRCSNRSRRNLALV